MPGAGSCNDEPVQLSMEGRQPAAQAVGEQAGGRAAVNQDISPCGGLDEQRVTSADIEDGQVQAAIRGAQNGAPGYDGENAQSCD